GLLASMLAGGPLATAQAARFNWQGNDGDWAVPANWFNDTLNVTATAPPGADDSATIFGQSSLVHYDLDGTGAALRAVTLYAHGTLLVEGGTLETGDIALGQKTANLPGWLTQSAGAVNVSGTLSVSGKANGNINDASLYRLE